MNLIKLEWWNTCDLGNIYYLGGFRNKIYLDAIIGEPSWDELEEGAENGDGLFVQDYFRSKKRYQFKCLVPEYLVDALKLIPAHDNKRISYTNGLFNADIDYCQVDVEWQDESNGCLGLVTFAFETGDQVVKTNCCVEL